MCIYHYNALVQPKFIADKHRQYFMKLMHIIIIIIYLLPGRNKPAWKKNKQERNLIIALTYAIKDFLVIAKPFPTIPVLHEARDWSEMEDLAASYSCNTFRKIRAPIRSVNPLGFSATWTVEPCSNYQLLPLCDTCAYREHYNRVLT